jgi:hypothetical protein
MRCQGSCPVPGCRSAGPGSAPALGWLSIGLWPGGDCELGEWSPVTALVGSRPGD